MSPTPTILSLLDETTASKPMVIGLSDIAEYLRSLYEIDTSVEEFPEKIMALMNDAYDKNGLKSWFNFYQPLMGTDTFINFILNAIKIESYIIPWYETSNPTNTFDLVLSQYPERLNREAFVDVINFYKNIESKLASMRLVDCPMRFTLDSSNLDEDLLSDTSGVDVNGTTFCFRVRHRVYYKLDDITTTAEIQSASSFRDRISDFVELGSFVLDKDIIEPVDYTIHRDIVRQHDSAVDLRIAHLVNGYRDFRIVALDYYGVVNVTPIASQVFITRQSVLDGQVKVQENISRTSNVQAYTNNATSMWSNVSGWAFGTWADYKLNINTQRSTETV